MNVNIQDIVLVIGVILTVLNIIERVILFKDKANKPHLQHEKRISALEKDVADIHREMNEANDRIGDLEKGTTILIRSMGALLSHGIEGNNTGEMIAVREDLNTYLSDRFNK